MTTPCPYCRGTHDNPASAAGCALQAMRKGRKGRPRERLRCPCGAMTRARAKKRGHKCEVTRTNPN